MDTQGASFRFLSRAGATALALTAAVGCSSGSSSTVQANANTTATATASPSTDRIAGLVDELSVLATGALPTADDKTRATDALATGQLAWRDYIDGLVGSEAAARYAPIVMFPHVSQAIRTWNINYDFFHLKSFKDESSRQVYHVHGKCSSRDAEDINPWWDPKSTVRVCKDSIRADVTRGASGVLCPYPTTGNTVCGCGPHLMNCVRTDDDLKNLALQVRGEFMDTITASIKNDRPLKQLFLGTETIRGPLVEFLYRRALVQTGADPELLLVTDFVADGKPKPRPERQPGQHAGLLTSMQMLNIYPGQREYMAMMGEVMWCIKHRSLQVTPDKVLSIPKSLTTSRLVGWQRLAAMPVCTTCHARMDYGLQFFRGWGRSNYDVKDEVAGTGKMFVEDLQDLRAANVPAIPQEYAKLALKQPEFGACMSERAVTHVFGRDAGAAELKAVNEEFKVRGTYKTAMGASLMTLVEQRLASSRSPVAATNPSPAATNSEPWPHVPAGHKNSKELKEAISDQCLDCHDDPDTAPKGMVLTGELTSPQLWKALAEVSAERMPPDASPTARHQLIRLLVAQLFTKADERDVALSYFTGETSNLGVNRFVSARQIVRQRAGVKQTENPDGKLSTIRHNRRDLLEYSPDFALSLMVEATAACREAGKTGDDLKRCVVDASDTRGIVAP